MLNNWVDLSIIIFCEKKTWVEIKREKDAYMKYSCSSGETERLKPCQEEELPSGEQESEEREDHLEGKIQKE